MKGEKKISILSLIWDEVDLLSLPPVFSLSLSFLPSLFGMNQLDLEATPLVFSCKEGMPKRLPSFEPLRGLVAKEPLQEID